MKLIKLSILLMILILPVTLAYSGGDTNIVGHFENCVNLTVKVTGEEIISPNEYYLNNCTEILPNEWFCECEGSYDLLMTTKINTLNIYTINTTYVIAVDSISNFNLSEIHVNNDDVIVYGMVYENKKLEFQLSSHGTKEVNIFLGDLGCPYQLTVNSVLTDFICENKSVIFNASFSTKNIVLNYNFPIPRKSSGFSYYPNLEKEITVIEELIIEEENNEEEGIGEGLVVEVNQLEEEIISENNMITGHSTFTTDPLKINLSKLKGLVKVIIISCCLIITYFIVKKKFRRSY
jgi:hypothetical protein